MLVKPLVYSPAALPSTTRAAPAKKRRLSTLNSTSKSATPLGLPTFADSSLDSSGAASSILAAHFQSIALRSPGVVCDHSPNASRAAATARSMSASVPFGTSSIVSSVAGFMTGVVSPSAASDQSPLMNMRRRVAVRVMTADLFLVVWAPYRNERAQPTTTAPTGLRRTGPLPKSQLLGSRHPRRAGRTSQRHTRHRLVA